MKSNDSLLKTKAKKMTAITALYITSIFIMILGIFFGVYSVLNSIYFTVINSRIHGLVFGLIVAYLGFRYFLKVRKLEDEVLKPTSTFSWENFKRKKQQV